MEHGFNPGGLTIVVTEVHPGRTLVPLLRFPVDRGRAGGKRESQQPSGQICKHNGRPRHLYGILESAEDSTPRILFGFEHNQQLSGAGP